MVLNSTRKDAKVYGWSSSLTESTDYGTTPELAIVAVQQ